MNKPISHRATIGEAVCPYCGVGCRLWAEAAYNEILRVKGAPEAAANLGGLCAKGATLPQVINTPDRLAQPQVRQGRNGGFRPTSWDQATKYTAERFRSIIERHGPDSVAFYGSGQLDSESVYLAVKLFKGNIGTNNTDSNSRLCMASAVAGYVATLGSDGPPTCYEDIDHADVLLIVGSNMAEAHPVTFDRIKARRAANQSQQVRSNGTSHGNPLVIVIDPRRTKTAEAGDIHVPVAPGGDVSLLNLLAKRLLQTDRVDHAFIENHTTGKEDLQHFLNSVDDDALLADCGVPSQTIDSLVDIIGNAKTLLSFYCMGLGQSTTGVAKHVALINLHLLTGQIGKEGAGPFSLTGQPNAMGGREGGLLAHQLPGYRLVKEAQHRREVEAYWGVPAGSISEKPGLTAVEMFRALERGKLKAIWIAATNPLVSLPDLHQARRALDRAEFIVTQDPYHTTETTQVADVVFPVANWSEKEWISTNSERMVSFSEKLIDPPGTARADWQVIAAVAQAMGYSGFSYESMDAIWNDFIRLTAGRPCDMSGMTAARLRAEKALQWPCPAVHHPGTKRRYLDQRFPTLDGKARLVIPTSGLPRETPDHEFPFVLTTGRLYAHWHTLTRTGKSPKLLKRNEAPYVEIHPEDAAGLGIDEGALVQIQSRRGTVRLPARLSPTLRRGMLFTPFHWGDQWGAELAVNYLTISAFDPVSKQPELKYCAVAAEAVPDSIALEHDLANRAEATALPARGSLNFLGWFRSADVDR